MKNFLACVSVSLFAIAATAANPGVGTAGDWPSYGRTPGGNRHSPLTQLTRDNVAHLTLAWEFKTGEAGIETGNPTALEATPLVVDGTLYLSTPLGRIVALDPVSGTQRWTREIK